MHLAAAPVLAPGCFPIDQNLPQRCALAARLAHRQICAGQQVRELVGVSHRLISEAVVYARLSAALTCVFPTQHSAWWRLDNCFRDQAVTNAHQLADLLTSANLPVSEPGG